MRGVRGNVPSTLAIMAACVVLDAVGKSVARAALPLSADDHSRGLHLAGVAGLEHVRNSGSALGFAQGGAAWLPLAALGVCLALAVPLMRGGRWPAAAAAGLLAGGALGNLVDRIRFGAVTDFILLGSSAHGVVFNPADLALAIGGLIALASAGRHTPPERKEGGERP